MPTKFKEYKKLDLPGLNREIQEHWHQTKAFHKSLEKRRDSGEFIFYEGPPSANGIPGIHHVISRTIKDIFCRYKTQKGYLVERKAGWDTHGLPVELSVEKSLGITKEDIGTKISISEYNEKCKQEVMRYTAEWEQLTDRMGYWIDMDHPYITYDNRYIETLWWLLKQLFEKDLLYKGYSVQPYSPAAGSGLSSHELNQPGCYRDVKDTTIVAQFEVIRDERSEFLFQETDTPVYLLAWTTTPWTLPSNTALTLGPEIDYVLVRSFNPYTGEPISVILAKELLYTYFPEKDKELRLEDYKEGDKHVPYKVLKTFKGKEFEWVSYKQLLDWVRAMGQAHKVLLGDFVTTDEGTGIVHTAPTFGADDQRVAQEYDISALLVVDKNGWEQPLVDKNGRFYRIGDLDPVFVKEYVNEDSYRAFAGRYVKNEYDPGAGPETEPTDVHIAVDLKKSGKAFQIAKYVHNYPHCWRTDKPVLYYPMDSWFIRTTKMKDKLIELNNTINWKPPSTGQGRFGKWLENLVDWNLSRSRFWGTPLPIWVTGDRQEHKAIGSVAGLKEEIEKAIQAGFMDENPLKDYIEGDHSAENYEKFDLHRPFVDEIVLVSDKGKKMFREPDLIDVWFDSGAMPYAQFHYPFERKEDFDKVFPADFIAEGVDQTRGWFFTLHAIATMVSGSVSFKNIISNGLILDKNGNKMSKRLGNAVDPFKTIDEHGADPLRWYLMTNAQPWDNLKFDISGVEEVKRKFFGTLYNTYSFFALYANVDGFRYEEEEIPLEKRPEIDRWIISLLNSLVADVDACYEDYEPTKAGRAIETFVLDHLSNWYVRLNRKRYWGGEYDEDKIAAYQTLYACLETVSMLMAPLVPFFADRLFMDLNAVAGRFEEASVHHTDFPKADRKSIDKALEERMDLAQKVSSMVLSLRRKVDIRVRQPLNKLMVPVLDNGFVDRFEAVKPLILSEVNVKEVEYITDTSGILVKKIKPNFKSLGPRYGKLMKQITAEIGKFSQEDIAAFEEKGSWKLEVDGQDIELGLEDVEILSEDIPGWLVASDGRLTVALDINITPELRQEGIARELVNRIQNYRKEKDFDVTDKIRVYLEAREDINEAVTKHEKYIAGQTLAKSVELTDNVEEADSKLVELEEGLQTRIRIERLK